MQTKSGVPFSSLNGQQPGQVNGILIDPLASNVPARRFYERLGFRFVEGRRFGDDECAVYRLQRRD